MKKFAQLLSKHVEASGMKQTRVATTAHISYNYLQRLLAGDRHPSDQVVNKLAQALHLTSEQTGELLAAAGHAPPLALLPSNSAGEQTYLTLSPFTSEATQVMRLTQQFYRLTQEIPETLHGSFSEEMKHLLGYVRYKYVLSGGANLLDLKLNFPNDAYDSEKPPRPCLDLIAQLVGTLYAEPEEEAIQQTEEQEPPPQAVEDMLSAIDRLTGNILAGEVSVSDYQPQVIIQILDMLREGAPWEIRRRIAEALPGLCRIDVSSAEHLMDALRLDRDDVRGVDIRRRVIEALPALFEISPTSLSVVINLLHSKSEDDIYVALATIEACGDIQIAIKQMLEKRPNFPVQSEAIQLEALEVLLKQSHLEISKLQRQLLVQWEETEREALQFSLALHNLLCAPDTLLLSLREGLQSSDKLVQWVATRYLERLLPTRTLETLELYTMLLQITTRRNVRRTVAKALPGLLQCLKESSLSIRAQTRTVIRELASDPDIHVRRAVADHAMQIFHIDREFLLILLRQMHKDTDQAIRQRLQPIALRLAQVWLIWYAETAGLVDTKHHRNKVVAPFGE